MGAFIKGLQFGIISSMIGNPFGHYNPFACSNPFCGGNFLPPMMNFGFNPFFNSFNSPLYNLKYFTPVLQEPVFSFNSGSNYNFNETYPSQSVASSGYINPTQFFTSKPVVYNDLMSNPWSSTIGDSFTRSTETKKTESETKAEKEKQETNTKSKESEKSKTKKETPVAKEDKPKANEAQQKVSEAKEKEKKVVKTEPKKTKAVGATATVAASRTAAATTVNSTIKLPGKYDEKFEKMLYEFVLGEEGDEINPNEPTKTPGKKQISYHGVLQSTYDEYRDQKGLPRQSVAKMKPEERDRLYYEKYYKLSGADKIKDPKLALYVFDAAINMGVGTAKSLLRQSNNNADRFFELRKKQYQRIGGEFLNGWMGRLDHIKKFAEEELC